MNLDDIPVLKTVLTPVVYRQIKEKCENDYEKIVEKLLIQWCDKKIKAKDDHRKTLYTDEIGRYGYYSGFDIFMMTDGKYAIEGYWTANDLYMYNTFYRDTIIGVLDIILKYSSRPARTSTSRLHDTLASYLPGNQNCTFKDMIEDPKNRYLLLEELIKILKE